MAATFAVRAGSSFRVNVEYREPNINPSAGALIDTSDMTARMQIRSGAGNRKVLLHSTASTSPSAVLSATPETIGQWHIFLSASITRTLPTVSYLEFELVNNLNADDVTTLFSGALHVTPQQVAETE